MLKRIKYIIRAKMCRSMQENDINYEELKEKVKNGAILVDVRSSQEYEEGHLAGAIQIADYEINSKAKQILPNKESEIIVYCQNGGRSRHAYDILKKLEYKNVYSLYGGLDGVS